MITPWSYIDRSRYTVGVGGEFCYTLLLGSAVVTVLMSQKSGHTNGLDLLYIIDISRLLFDVR